MQDLSKLTKKELAGRELLDSVLVALEQLDTLKDIIPAHSDPSRLLAKIAGGLGSAAGQYRTEADVA